MPARMKNPMLRPAVLPRSTINPASAEVIPHKMDCVGLAYTEVPDTVQTETDPDQLYQSTGSNRLRRHPLPQDNQGKNRKGQYRVGILFLVLQQIFHPGQNA